jgi:hypothetical protein
MIKPLIFFTFLVVLTTLLLGAVDVGGVWAGPLDLMLPAGQKVASHLYVSFRQSGGEIKGSAGPSERKQTSIRNVNVDGRWITFEAGPENETLLFKLALGDGHLKGQAQGENGMKAQVDLTRISTRL